MATLEHLMAREVLDSRGTPTVEVEATASGGARARAIAPAGQSPGRFESCEQRDNDLRRFGGKGVRRAVDFVTSEIAPALAGMDLDDQQAFDNRMIELDGSTDKGRLGGNAIYAVSMAVARAAAAARGEELFVHLHRLWRNALGPNDAPDAGPILPLPLVSLIAAATLDGHGPDFQDYLIVPLGARSFGHALEMVADVHRSLGDVLRDYAEEADLVTDGGAYGPRLRANGLGVQRMLEALTVCGLQPGADVAVAINLNAARLLDPKTGLYHLAAEGDDLDAGRMTAMLEHWAHQFPIVSIEDALAEDDWDGWARLTERLGDLIQIAGGDLFATRADRIAQGAARGAANAVVIKPNQAGTLSETFDALLAARRAGYRAIVASRTGETEDTTIADLAVATGCGQVKFGGMARSERVAKYNRLLRIAEVLGGVDAPYAGRAALSG